MQEEIVNITKKEYKLLKKQQKQFGILLDILDAVEEKELYGYFLEKPIETYSMDKVFESIKSTDDLSKSMHLDRVFFLRDIATDFRVTLRKERLIDDTKI